MLARGVVRRTFSSQIINGDVLEPIRKRRSYFLPTYSGKMVPQEQVWSLLNSAVWAPFHGKERPWRFVILGREAMKEMTVRTRDWYRDCWDGPKDKKEFIVEKMSRTTKWGNASYVVGEINRKINVFFIFFSHIF